MRNLSLNGKPPEKRSTAAVQFSVTKVRYNMDITLQD
jgi:hypothetical protein